MIKFGILKSKVENVLLESYNNDTFKTEIQNFKKLVLENKNINKIFFLYDDLSSDKGLNESVINDYINECITIYENTINKIKQSDIDNLKKWVGNTKTENIYESIDNLFSTDILTIESRINSKKLISESLKKQPKKVQETVNVPLTSMVNIANKTISTYIQNLEESDRKELTDLLTTSDEELKTSYETIKENVISKLTQMKLNESDSTTKETINETISKVSSEKYDKLTYFKLKSLNENL
jgi:hypothetical protein